MVTSANSAPMTAYVSISLAHSLAEVLQRRVVLVDAHPRVGDVSRLLGCDAALGYSDMLIDQQLQMEGLLLATSNPQVSVLPAGLASGASRPRSPEDHGRVVSAIAGGLDFVVLHAGPVLDHTSALALAPFVARVMLVAFEHQTLLGDLDLAQRALRACQARQIGMVIACGPADR
jgi:MinD-like ATPase involved in chromosome partitioning or flagellar assembly